MSNKNIEFNDMQIDAIKEIGNIGKGNAGTALSEILNNKTVDMNVSKVKMLEYEDFVNSFGGNEALLVGIISTLTNDLEGMIMVLMRKDCATTIINEWVGADCEDLLSIDDLNKSAIQEAANIMKASYLNSISQFSGLTIGLSAPDICIDMVGSILDVPAAYFANMSRKIMVIEDDFASQGWNDSRIILLLEVESLKKLLNALGMD